MVAMAAITWKSTSNVYSPIYPPVVPLVAAPLDEDAPDSAAASSASATSQSGAGRAMLLLKRLCWRHALLLSAVQELLLLLLVGGSTAFLAFSIDKISKGLSTARAQAVNEESAFLLRYLMWTGSSLVLCGLSAACVQFIGPNAAGSGIPQMKCVLAGVQIHDYLSLRTLLAKAASLVLALAGGLSIGKEGPYVHMASCVAQQLCRLRPFRRLAQNDHLRRQVLSAACAAGVSATFGAPVGGVLFSIEVGCHRHAHSARNRLTPSARSPALSTWLLCVLSLAPALSPRCAFIRASPERSVCLHPRQP